MNPVHFCLLISGNWSLAHGEKGNVARKTPAPERRRTFTVHFPVCCPFAGGRGRAPSRRALHSAALVPRCRAPVPCHGPRPPLAEQLLVHRRVSQRRGLKCAGSYGSCQEQSSK